MPFLINSLHIAKLNQKVKKYLLNFVKKITCYSEQTTTKTIMISNTTTTKTTTITLASISTQQPQGSEKYAKPDFVLIKKGIKIK